MKTEELKLAISFGCKTSAEAKRFISELKDTQCTLLIRL